MNQHLSAPSAFRTSPALGRSDLIYSVLILLIGFGSGVLAKATDSHSLLGALGTELAVWIFLASLVAIGSRHPVLAALNTLVFFLAMLASYYLYTHHVLGFFPRAYAATWLRITWLTPFPAFMLWYGRHPNLLAHGIASLPVATLLFLGSPGFYSLRPTTLLSLCMGLALIPFFDRSPKGMATILGLAVLLAVLLRLFAVPLHFFLG